jgi:hypothetical protein
MRLLLFLLAICVGIGIGTHAEAAKLSLVRGLQWRRHGRRRHELWVHNISTMPGYRAWDWRILHGE